MLVIIDDNGYNLKFMGYGLQCLEVIRFIVITGYRDN
jgi:hypothetical protein